MYNFQLVMQFFHGGAIKSTVSRIFPRWFPDLVLSAKLYFSHLLSIALKMRCTFRLSDLPKLHFHVDRGANLQPSLRSNWE